jgi:AcrR family transcriptional regulator
MARPRTDIQPRILKAARARFLAEGVDGASLRTIAADAGTNVGMIFYYFPTKDDLFLAVVEQVYAGLLEDLGRALSPDLLPVRQRLERAFARLGTASDDEMEVVRLVAREALISSERFGKVLARAQRGHVGMMLMTLQEAVASGEVDGTLPLPLVLVTTFAMGGLPQLIRRAAAGTATPLAMLPPAPELAKASVELLFKAIGGPARAAKASRKTVKKR